MGVLVVMPKILLVTLAPTTRCFLAGERDRAVAQDNTKAVITELAKNKGGTGPSRGTKQLWNVAVQEQQASFWAWMAWHRPASRLPSQCPRYLWTKGREDLKGRQFCFHYETTRP